MLEAIVALAIIGLVCVGVLAAHGAALRADVTAAERLPLSTLAVERLAAIDVSGSSLDMLPDSLTHGTFTQPYADVQWQVSTHRVDRIEGLYELSVAVSEGTNSYALVTRRYRTPVRVQGAFR